MQYCKVILTNSLQNFSEQDLGALSYAIPDDFSEKLARGSLVLVPFRNQKENALIISIYDELSEAEKKFKIREIEDVLSEPGFFEPELIELMDYVADYYACSYPEVVSAVFPSSLIKKPEKRLSLLDPEAIEDSPLFNALKKARKNTASWQRLKVLSGLKEDQLKKETAKLKRKNLIELSYHSKAKKEAKKTNPLDRLKEFSKNNEFELSLEQYEAVTKIAEKLNTYHNFLVHGVTGSGKTEVYMRLIEKVFEQGNSAIVLIPEISLAPQLMDRLSARFSKDNVYIWHSALSKSEKEYTFSALQDDSPKVVIGARSAIFCPIKKLGLIVIDEEHENSYKQEEPAPRYHTRVVAEKRAKLNNCPLVLGSATPSIEAYYKAFSETEKNYSLLKLKKRVFANPMPKVSVIDMREEFNNGNKSVFARSLKIAIEDRLAKGEQVILFLNKRGLASHVFCRNCGYVYKCEHCDSKIVYHADKKALVCHHCGYTEAHPEQCPQCNSRAIKFFGLGTQKLEMETKRYFPDANVVRLDSDVSRQGNKYIDVFEKFKNNEIDILIGTQMIAKGLDNPNVTLVGVISADGNFSQLDYTADERGFQLLTQVAGRAGRADKLGQVFFQTYQPERPVIEDAKEHDYLGFYQREIELREEFFYPPFGKTVRFKASAENEVLAIQTVNDFHKVIFGLLEEFSYQAQVINYEQSEDDELDDSKEVISILGPCPCVISKINNKYRYHILLKIPSSTKADEFLLALKEAFRAYKARKYVVFNIDIDSMSLY